MAGRVALCSRLCGGGEQVRRVEKEGVGKAKDDVDGQKENGGGY